MLNSIEVFIYKFYEGLLFWPEWLKNNSMESIKQNYKNNIDEYPFNPKSGIRYPKLPTRLGNIMAEFETYSNNQYGMDMSIFWPHMRLLLTKDIKEDLDIRGAKADFFVYMSFIFLTYPVIAGWCVPIQLISYVEEILSIENNIAIRIIIIVIGFIVMCFVSLALSYTFYLASITALKTYGYYVKALFDLYRFNLAEKFDTEMSVIPPADEIEWWRDFGTYLETQVIKEKAKK